VEHLANLERGGDSHQDSPGRGRGGENGFEHGPSLTDSSARLAWLAFHDVFPIFHTPDVSRAVAFYSDRLRFEQRYRFPEDGDAAFVLMGLGPFSLGLTQSNDVAAPGRVALWLYTEDVDREIGALREADVEIVKEPEDMEWGERMATVLDPDGNEIFIGQRLKN
jgi:lactoylglutathione lyase